MTRITVPLSHEDLASMGGSTRETVSATLARLAHDGVVRTGRRELAVAVERARALLEEAP
jgi:CRP-like cAMP-binding protein